MNIDLKEGFRRLFLLVSIIFFLFFVLEAFWEDTEAKFINFIIATIIPIILYYSFYLWCWLFSGFKKGNDTKNNLSDKAETKKELFYKRLQHRFTELNFKKPFFLLLIIFIFLFVSYQDIRGKFENLKFFYVSNLTNNNQNLENQVASLTAENNKLKSLIGHSRKNKGRNKGYFTIGSTKSEVMAVQGQPSSINETYWTYGLSTIDFQNGKVTGYSNIENNLKVRGGA